MEENNKNNNEQQDKMIELGADLSKSSRGNIYTLTIIGQIEGHQVLPETVKTTKYEHILPLLAGIEARTSSPVRILRDPVSCESVSVKGIYPCGEGAGYAGGITSAATDGLRVALAIANKLGGNK